MHYPLKDGDGNASPPLPTDPDMTVAIHKGILDRNYVTESAWDSQSELMKLKVENQALIQLLNEEIKKRTSSHLKITYEASSA